MADESEWRIVAICVNEHNPLIEPILRLQFSVAQSGFFNDIQRCLSHRNLANRDIKSRYSRALIGFGWTFLEPLLLSIVYYALFTIIAGRPEPLYALHVITGVIIWGHFGKSLQASVASLTKGKNLIKQVYFPREILAISPVVAQFWISCTSLLAVIPIMIYLDVKPTIQLL